MSRERRRILIGLDSSPGSLRGLAFQKGSRGEGGMASDFDVSAHRLEPLRVDSQRHRDLGCTGPRG